MLGSRRVVVEVAHGNDPGRGVGFQHRIGDPAHLLPDGDAFEFRSVLAAQPRRPVRHHEEEGFVVDPSPHRQDVAGLEIRERRHDGFHRIAALQFEDFGAVEKSHVDAARLGRIVVHDTIIGWRQFGRRHDILEHGAVFDLRHADHGRIDLVGSRKVEQYPFDVAQLAVVLGRVPLFGPFGGELVVEHLGVVDRIEEILQVVEHHLVGLLREARHNECRQQQGEYQSFFHRSEILRFYSPHEAASFCALTAAGTEGKNSKPVRLSTSETLFTQLRALPCPPAFSTQNPMDFSWSAG